MPDLTTNLLANTVANTTGETSRKKRVYPAYKQVCGALKSDRETYCGRPAGWGTDHNGEGKCKHHGGRGGRKISHGGYASARTAAKILAQIESQQTGKSASKRTRGGKQSISSQGDKSSRGDSTGQTGIASSAANGESQTTASGPAPATTAKQLPYSKRSPYTDDTIPTETDGVIADMLIGAGATLKLVRHQIEQAMANGTINLEFLRGASDAMARLDGVRDRAIQARQRNRALDMAQAKADDQAGEDDPGIVMDYVGWQGSAATTDSQGDQDSDQDGQ